MARLKLFRDRTDEERTKSLGDFLPGGRLFHSKNIEESNLRNLLLGLAREIGRVDSMMNDISSEHDPRITEKLIAEWERALGIPDGCFSNTEDLATRREQVVQKLSMAVSTREDFIALAAALGFTVEITGGAYYGVFTMVFPIMFFPTAKAAKFTMLVDLDASLNPSLFTLVFPFTFGAREGNIIECLFNKLKPANVEAIYRYIL